MKLSIYRKLLMFTLPVVCFSIFGVGYYSYLIANEEVMSQIRAKMQDQAEDAAAELNRLGSQADVDLITLSQLTSIRDYNNNYDFELYAEAELCRKAIETFVLDFSRRSKVYAGVGYVNQNGIEVAKVIRNEIEPKRGSVIESRFFKEAERLKPAGIYVSPVVAGKEGQGMIVRRATPILNEIGEFKGVMTLDLDFGMVQNMVRNIRSGKSGYAFLIDHGGDFLGLPEKARTFIRLEGPELKRVVEDTTGGKRGWMVFRSLNGDALVGYAPVEVLKGAVVVIAPLSEFMARINQIKINSALVMFLSGGIATFGILIIARKLSRPIKTLVSHTRMVSEGKYGEQMKVTSTDETGELTRSFNEMTLKLKSSQQEIEAWNMELEERVRLTAGKLATEKEKFEAVFQHMADGVIVLDEFSRVVDLNSAAEAYIGMEKAALVGEQILMAQKAPDSKAPSFRKNLEIVCQPKFEEGYMKCWDYFDCQKRECPAYRSNELRCWLVPETQCDHSGNIKGSPEVKIKRCLSCGLFVRISEKYRNSKQRGTTEVALGEPKRDLRIFKSPMFDNQSRFMGHVIVLQDITKDKELDKMKSDFVSNVSHELRTPLTSIKSFSELILDDLDTMDTETRKRFLGIIRDEAERLTRLISDILDLQRIQANKMKWRMDTVDVGQLIENSVSTFSGLTQAKGIQLSFQSKGNLRAIQGDRDRLQQVLVNLISNAIKFSSENGQIIIEAAEVPEGVLLSVTDRGIGIPVDKRERIFERFYQVDSSATKERKGTGLGLAISKEIVEHYGGRIWVESKVGEGSKFSFVIPRGSKDSHSVLLS